MAGYCDVELPIPPRSCGRHHARFFLTARRSKRPYRRDAAPLNAGGEFLRFEKFRQVVVGAASKD